MIINIKLCLYYSLFLDFWLQIVLDDLNHPFKNFKISTMCYLSQSHMEHTYLEGHKNVREM